MKKRSDRFYPGEHRDGTLITIVDSVKPDSWDQIVCLCDCGKVFTATYMEVYRGMYSCGCRRRLRKDSVDYTNLNARNGSGNEKHGRSLTVIGRDEVTQQWQYLCDCCGSLFFVPRGNERGMARVLRDEAGKVCPNYRFPWYVRPPHHAFTEMAKLGIYVQHDPKSPDGWYEIPSRRSNVARCIALRIPKAGNEYKMAHALVAHYNPEHVLWEGRPRVLVGFKGMPNMPDKLPFYVSDAQNKYGYFGEGGKVSFDPDGFADFTPELLDAGVTDQEQEEIVPDEQEREAT